MTSSKSQLPGPVPVLDTHIHLWPSTATSPTNHGWMTPGLFLAKRHGVEEYRAATRGAGAGLRGFVYVETDRYLPSRVPGVSEREIEALRQSDDGDLRGSVVEKMENWAKEPLEELKFLRRIVEGRPEEGDGFQPEDSGFMVGCVVWAPFHLRTELFDLFLDIAERVAGPRLWEKVVGFRYLLQGIKVEVTLRDLLESKHWLNNILRLRSGRGGKGWAFDIGVDTHSTGVWQVDAAAAMVETIREMETAAGGDAARVRFVLNHLCKPDLSHGPQTLVAPSFSRWERTVGRLAKIPGVYLKLSGALNEFAPSRTPGDVRAIVDKLDPYLDVVFDFIRVRRLMFGSDWPVCNVGGPAGEKGNWELWREVVERVVEEYYKHSGEDGEEGRRSVWTGAGCEAYGIELGE